MGLADHRSPPWKLLVEIDLGVEQRPAEGPLGSSIAPQADRRPLRSCWEGPADWYLPLLLICMPLHNEPLAWAIAGPGWAVPWGECVLPKPTGDCHQEEAGCTQSTCCRSAILDPSLWRPPRPHPTPQKPDRGWVPSSCHPSERLQSAGAP